MVYGIAATVLTMFGFMWLFIILFFGLFLVAFIFWILMLIDAAKRKFPGENDQLIWILIIVLAGIIGAIIYYFVIKRKNNVEEKTMKKTIKKSK